MTMSTSVSPPLLLRRWVSTLRQGALAAITAGSAGLLLIFLLVAARHLTPADYGRLSFAIALATVAEAIMDLGLNSITVREVARHRAGAFTVVRRVLGAKTVWLAIGLVFVGITAPLLRHEPAVVRACYLLGASSACRSLLLTTRGVLQGLQRFGLEAVIVVADRGLLLAVGWWTLAAGHGLLGVAVAFAAVRVVLLVAVVAVVAVTSGIPWPTYDAHTWRDTQRAAITLGLFAIAINVSSYVDTILLGVFRSNEETGQYAAAYRIYEGLTYAPSIVAAVLTPRLAYLHAHAPSRVRQTLRHALALAVTLGAVLGSATVAMAPWGLRVLFGASYAAAAAPLRVLSGGAVFVFGAWVLHAGAIAMDRDRQLLRAAAVGTVANLLLNLAVIPTWGMTGSAWATVAAEALTVGLLWRDLTGAPVPSHPV